MQQRRESQLREAETTLEHLRANVAELTARQERLVEADPATQYVVTVRGHGFRVENVVT